MVTMTLLKLLGSWGGGRHPNNPGRVAAALPFNHKTSIRVLFKPEI